MRVISVHPVWAWAIVHGHKPVENRSWNTRHRGPLAIHATKRGPSDEAARQQLAALGIDVPAEVPRGAIVGTVTLTDCVPLTEYSHPLATGPCCWLLSDAQPLAAPIPAPGQQRLWTTAAL